MQPIPKKPDECDACAKPPTEFFNNMWLCADCRRREGDAMAYGYVGGAMEINIPSRVLNMINGTQPVNPEVLSVLEKARKIDHALTTRADLYNAETIAIKDVELNLPPDTPNKNFVLAKLINERIEKYQGLIFGKNEELIALHNQQRAAQTFLNTLANTLRLEEREQLKLRDLNYKPKEVKPVKDVKLPKGTNKPDKEQIRIAATNLSIELHKPIPEFMLQMICISKNLTVAQGADFLRKQIKEAESENQ